MEKRIQTHIPYGFVIALAMIIIGVIFEVTGLSYKPGVQWISTIAFLIGIILNAQAFSKANDADVTFRQVFSSGFKATAIVAIVMFVWSFIVLMVFPGMSERALEIARAKMVADPKVSEEQVEMAMGFTKKYFSLLLHAGALFGTLAFGAVFSLIGAALAKRTPRQRFDIQ